MNQHHARHVIAVLEHSNAKTTTAHRQRLFVVSFEMKFSYFLPRHSKN
jgi:hypothetical protein